ncbi:ImmA/IrrE family metallo-endopeptidase [Caminicella sporogenes]|uniref:ImmA/IrrE family metallo-endopeptidase n=1 Tax=Caminicella sporogenes TaxID=166485 RepID=UPI002541AB93|nr:ImmA/IrrE family metallo-endopeptidase [Caminicella sporogenes]WIF95058.1 ImmA/IrrE family metallo-endopeptidase [Caminicella sporogenes]
MVKEIVLGLIELYNTKNPFELCDYLDIIVIKHFMGNKIQGFFQKTNDGIEILHINSELDHHTQKYICAHELGHAILQPELSIGFFIEYPFQLKTKAEIQADKFAAELLIPDDILKMYPDYTLEQIAAAENIPLELLKLKFNIKI